MKPKAAIFFLWPKHFPVLSAFAEKHRDFLIIVPNEGLNAIPMFKPVSDRIVAYSSLLTSEELVPLLSHARELARFLREYPSAPGTKGAWQEFCEYAAVPPVIAAEALFKDVESRLLEILVQMECLEKLRDRLDIRLVTVTEEFTRLSRSLAIWALARRIPVLHANHSLGMGTWYTVHDKLVSDVLAVYGPLALDPPAETGLPANRIWVGGNPDWSVYQASLPRKQEIRQEILSRYFQGMDFPLVVFAPTACAELTALEATKDPSDQVRAFFRSLAVLKKSGNRIHCLIKLRANNGRLFAKPYSDIAVAEGIHPGDFLFVYEDTVKVMFAADVVVSVDSTMSVEALLADTVSIDIITEWGCRRGPFYPEYTGILSCPEEELADCIREALGNDALKKRLSEMRSRSRTAYQRIGAGEDPATRLAGLLGSMASATALESRAGNGVAPYPNDTLLGEDFASAPESASVPGGITLIIRPTGNLDQLRTLVDSLPGISRPGFAVICLVAPAHFESVRNALPKGTILIRTGGSPHSSHLLGLLSSAVRGRVVAFLDAHVRLPEGWDRRLSGYVAGKVAVGPLTDQMAGTQSIYHYLPFAKVQPRDVDATSRNVRLRYPGMALSANWLYDHALVFGSELLAEMSGLPDDPSDDYFLGLGRKLGLAGARLMVAKDVYVSMEP